MTAMYADARIVHQHVNGASPLEHTFDGGSHRMIVRHVHLDRFNRQVLVHRQAVQFEPLFCRAPGGKDPISAMFSGQEDGRGLAETSVPPVIRTVCCRRLILLSQDSATFYLPRAF